MARAIPWYSRWMPIIVAGVYLLGAEVYILFSDRVLNWLVRDPDAQTRIQSVKGTAFVLGTGVLLFLTLRLYVRLIEGAQGRLRESRERHRQQAEVRRRLLNELDHRVKNNLAALSGLISFYERDMPEAGPFARRLDGAVMAMKRTHELISSLHGQSIELSELIRRLRPEDLPHAGDVPLVLEGPPVRLAPRRAQPLAMIVQELFQNSRKHGALSQQPVSPIEVDWQVTSEPGEPSPWLRLVWSERGAALAGQPSREGLGLRLIRGFAAHELSGTAEVLFDAGFHCVLRVPLEPVPVGGGTDFFPSDLAEPSESHGD